MKLIPIICPICGKSFKPRSHREIYCSRSCASKSHPIWNKGLTGLHNSRKGLQSGKVKSCLVCGKEFYCYPSDADDHKCCSQKCYHLSREGQTLIMPPGWKENNKKSMQNRKARQRKPPIMRICEYCQKEFEQKQRSLKRIWRFCSKGCYRDWLKLFPENHPTYKGGRIEYYGPDWRPQRRLARKRDNNKCRSCGQKIKGVSMDVHHIKPFREFNGDWKEANKLTNLITLCRSCHSGHNCHAFPLPLI